MDFRQFHYVLKVSEERSFSKAAQKLYIAQPSLSQFIIKLEQQIGVPLFDRSTTPLCLTYAGELYVKTAKIILDLNEQLIKQMADISNDKKGRIVVGLSSFRSTYIMPSVLPVFKERCPGIEVVLVEGVSPELEKLALNGVTDFSIAPYPIIDDMLEYELILTEEILLAISQNHPLSVKYRGSVCGQRPSINLKLLKDEPFILLKPEQQMHKIGIQLCRQAGFEPQIALETKSIEAINSLAIAGLGVSFIPDSLLRFGLVSRLPNYFSIEGMEAARKLAVVYRKGRYLSSAAREFISTMKEVLG